MAVSQRATCPVCRKVVPVTAAGTLRKHSTYATVCPQSGSEVPSDCPFAHEDWCQFGDHEGPCYRQMMEAMEQADPDRWERFLDGEDWNAADLGGAS